MTHARKILRVSPTHRKDTAIRQSIFRQPKCDPFVEPHDLLDIVQQTDKFLPRIGHFNLPLRPPQHHLSAHLGRMQLILWSRRGFPPNTRWHAPRAACWRRCSGKEDGNLDLPRGVPAKNATVSRARSAAAVPSNRRMEKLAGALSCKLALMRLTRRSLDCLDNKLTDGHSRT